MSGDPAGLIVVLVIVLLLLIAGLAVLMWWFWKKTQVNFNFANRLFLSFDILQEPRAMRNIWADCYKPLIIMKRKEMMFGDNN